MADDPAQLAAAYFDTWRAKDFDGYQALLADNVSFAGPLGTADGPQECRQGIERLSQITKDIVVQKVFVAGPDVLTWFELHTNVTEEPLTVANWIHTEGGKIERIRVTFDPRPLGA